MIPVGDLSPRRTGMRKKCFPQTLVRIHAEKKIRRGNRNGELFSGEEFAVAIPSYNRYGAVCFRFILNMIFAAAESIL